MFLRRPLDPVFDVDHDYDLKNGRYRLRLRVIAIGNVQLPGGSTLSARVRRSVGDTRSGDAQGKVLLFYYLRAVED